MLHKVPWDFTPQKDLLVSDAMFLLRCTLAILQCMKKEYPVHEPFLSFAKISQFKLRLPKQWTTYELLQRRGSVHDVETGLGIGVGSMTMMTTMQSIQSTWLTGGPMTTPITAPLTFLELQ